MNGLLEASARLHAAALEPDEWAPAVESVATLLGADHAILVAYGEPGAPFAATARLREDHRALFLSPLSAELFVPYQRAIPRGFACLRQQIVSDEVFARSVVYNEIIRPADGFHSVSVSESGPDGFTFSACRGRRRRAFGASESARLQSLLPHMSTALEFGRRLRTAEHRSASLTAVLDRLRSGVILTDSLSRPSYANERALTVIGEGDGLRAPADGLAASNPAATRALRDAIDRAGAADAAGVRRLTLPRLGRSPLLLSLMPVGRIAAPTPGRPASTVAIFIAEPEATSAIDRTALADAYRLTPRECDVVALLAHGLSPAGIAEALDVSVGSVRQYLKRAFDKTGRRSQGALVALALGFSTTCR